MTARQISSTIALLVLLPLRAGAQEVPPAVRTAAACAPAGSPTPSESPRVTVPASDKKKLFTVGEVVRIDRGADGGLRPGQRYMLRRPMHFQGAPNAQHTIGWLHVTDATASTATAQIDFTCDTVTVGDHLEPFSEVALSPESMRTFVGGKLDVDRVIRLSYGSDGRSLFGNSDFVLAEGGQDQGVAPGTRYGVLRGSDSDTALAEAVVVAAYGDQSLLYFTSVHDAVFTGDKLALRVGARDPGPAGGRSAVLAGASDPTSRGVPQNRPAPSSAATRTADEAPSNASPQSVTFEDVHFALNRSALQPEARALLDEAVDTLRADPTLHVEIDGYTCNIGTPQYNLVLGQRRADAVREYLVAKGVAGERLTTVSYGEEKPAHDNSRPETRPLNRRAVLVVSIQR
jgi:peptidoglycan-associated lipoprotein